MFNTLKKIFNYLNLKSAAQSANNFEEKTEKIPGRIDKIETKLETVFSKSSDFKSRQVVLGEDSQYRLLIAYLDGMVDKEKIEDRILKPLMVEARKADLGTKVAGKSIISILEENLLNAGEVEETSDFKQTVEFILAGDTVIFAEGLNTALKLETKGWETRSVEEPQSDVVVRGPREGFVETLQTNIALLRRRIKTSDFKFEMFKLGAKTKTDVAICYIDGLAHEEVINRVKRRLNEIDTDAILESGYIEEFIEDAPLSIFATVGYNERPDVTAGKLLEGRVAILCDGTPFVLTVPYLFVESIQFNADYYLRASHATLVRMLRLLALLVTVFLPAFFCSSGFFSSKCNSVSIIGYYCCWFGRSSFFTVYGNFTNGNYL
jgi:spore germination protein KA